MVFLCVLYILNGVDHKVMEHGKSRWGNVFVMKINKEGHEMNSERIKRESKDERMCWGSW